MIIRREATPQRPEAIAFVPKQDVRLGRFQFPDINDFMKPINEKSKKNNNAVVVVWTDQQFREAMAECADFEKSSKRRRRDDGEMTLVSGTFEAPSKHPLTLSLLQFRAANHSATRESVFWVT